MITIGRAPDTLDEDALMVAMRIRSNCETYMRSKPQSGTSVAEQSGRFAPERKVRSLLAKSPAKTNFTSRERIANIITAVRSILCDGSQGLVKSLSLVESARTVARWTSWAGAIRHQR